jgi:hypothetical protein
MKLLLVPLFIVACVSVPHAARVQQSGQQSSALFTDSTVYRAQCKESDTLPTLARIPQKCTLRDQRLKIQ